MAINSTLKLIEYRKKTERQQEALMLASVFTKQDIESLNEVYSHIIKICDNRLARIIDIQEATQS